MDSLEELIEASLARGVMTQKQHDRMMELIQKDGEIDEGESAQLSRVFAAVKNGTLRIIDSEREQFEQRARESEQRTQEAKQREYARQREQAERIGDIIDRALAVGSLSQKEHDRILRRIHADGQIDAAEKEQMSRLFSLIHSGKIKLVDEAAARSSAARKQLEEATREAIDRDETREDRIVRSEAPVNAAPAASEPEPQFEDIVEESEPNPLPPPVAAAPEGLAFEESAARRPADPASGLSSHQDLLRDAAATRTDGPMFSLHNDRMLNVSLSGKIWIKTGSMVAYSGIMRFTREGITEHGLGRTLKKAISGEGTMLTKATGQGSLYLADRGKKISVVDLKGHTLVVNGQSLLAFQDSVQWDITVLKQFAAMWAGGLFNVRMSGSGMVAITTVGDPVTLRVRPHEPLMTDVNATVAWSGTLAPQFKTDIAANTFIGRTSGETVQMRFEGDGFVIIQPYEESPNTSPAQ